MKKVIYIISITTLFSIATYSQTSNYLNEIKESSEKISSIGRIDNIVNYEAIPSDPIFDLLNLTGKEVSTPGTMNKFLASITNTTGFDGKLKTGIAISITPLQMFKSGELKDYISSFWERVKCNFQLSLGTAPDLNTDSTLNWGIGIRIPFLNSGDGRLDIENIEQLKKKSDLIFESIPVPDVADSETRKKILAERKKLEEKLSDQMKKLDTISNSIIKNGQKPDWNTDSFELVAGVVFTATDSKIQKSGFNKFRAWLGGSFGTLKYLQLLGQAGVVIVNNEVSTDSVKFKAAGMIRGGISTFRLGFGFSTDDFKKGILSTAGEVKISDFGWITFAIDRYVEEHRSPYWKHGVGVKTTVGNFNLF